MVEPILKIKMDNKFFDKTESCQAEAGDPGNQGLRGSRDPGSSAFTAEETHQPQILLLLQCRMQPRLATAW